MADLLRRWWCRIYGPGSKYQKNLRWTTLVVISSAMLGYLCSAGYYPRFIRSVRKSVGRRSSLSCTWAKPCVFCTWYFPLFLDTWFSCEQGNRWKVLVIAWPASSLFLPVLATHVLGLRDSPPFFLLDLGCWNTGWYCTALTCDLGRPASFRGEGQC